MRVDLLIVEVLESEEEVNAIMAYCAQVSTQVKVKLGEANLALKEMQYIHNWLVVFVELIFIFQLDVD